MQTNKQNQAKIKPVQLISFDSDKKLVLSEQAINIFNTLQAQQLSIVTVAGKYRTGKSYILNRVLLNQNSGFQVGPTINACTKGLWMWPKIVEIGIENSVRKCIIIDTQGLGSLQQGQNTDIKIFLMAALLSSYLIYNSVGSIDQKAIQNLGLVINLAQLLHRNQNHYDSQELINSFPSFMWLVRDFSLRLQNQKGQPITSTQYLQNALKYQIGTSQGIQRKNSIRKKLKTFFHDRNCFTLIRPTQNQKDLQNLSTLPQRRLRPQFVRLINQLKSLISVNLKPKKVRGKSVTPQGFIQLCKYFINTINSGKLPSLNSHWDNLCLKQASRIIQTITMEHEKNLLFISKNQEDVDKKFKNIQTYHKQAIKEANQKIDKSFLGKLQKQLCKQKLQKILMKNYENVIKQINQFRYSIVKSIVKQIFTEIMNQFNQNKLESFQEIFGRFQQIKQKYKHDSRIYESFYENSKDVFQQFLKSLKQHWSREQSVLCQKNEYLQSTIAEKTHQMRQKIQQYAQSLRDMQNKNYRIQLHNSQLQSYLQELKLQIINLKQKNNILNQTVQKLQINNQKNILQQLDSTRKRMETQINSIRTELHKTQIQLVKYKQLYKQSNIKQRKTLRQMEIFKNKCSQYLKQNIQLGQRLEIINKKLIQIEQNKRKQIINDYTNIENRNKNRNKFRYRTQSNQPQFQESVQNQFNSQSAIMHSLNAKINQLQMRISMKQEENKNLSRMLNDQKMAHQTLLRAPQNLNYSLLKKNYQMQKQTNKSLSSKVKQFQLIFCLSQLKCLLCNKKVDKLNTKNHFALCSQMKSVTFDVSYEYNGNGQIQFIIDVYLDDQEWTVRKTVQNIKHYFKKMGIQNNQLFKNLDVLGYDIAKNEQRRIYLDQLFNDHRSQLWSNIFLIEYFGIDLYFINCKNDTFKGGSMKGSKVSIDLDGILDQNNQIQNTNMLMRTTKFNKKTFNFGNI